MSILNLKKNKSLLNTTLFLLLFFTSVGLLNIKNTNSYYNDIENSQGNYFTAGSLYFSLISDVDFDPVVTSDTHATRTIDIVNEGSLNFEYRITAENVLGDLCNSLDLTAKLDSVEKYTGTIAELDQAPFIFSDSEAWDFTAHLNSLDPSLAGLSCTFDLVYTGWQKDLTEDTSGFTYTETISNTVTAGETILLPLSLSIDSEVVLDEVLLDPETLDLESETTSVVENIAIPEEPVVESETIIEPALIIEQPAPLLTVDESVVPLLIVDEPASITKLISEPEEPPSILEFLPETQDAASP